MHSPDEFWRGRLARHGHTGWADPSVYCYDQLERVGLVESELDRLAIRRGRALDFGCGTGDFARRLLDRGMQVVGYDPFVRPAIGAPHFRYISNLDELGVDDATQRFDLILSVTVLDHLLDASELRAVLTRLRGSLSETGRLLMLEYSLDAEEERASDYQAFRSLKTWRETLADSGFSIDEVKPVPQPEQSPSDGHLAFARRIPVRLTARLGRRLPIAPRLLAPLLARLARRDFARFGPGRVASSPLKLHTCKPI